MLKSVRTTIRTLQEGKERRKSAPAAPRYVPIHPSFGSLITCHHQWASQTTQQIRNPSAGCRPLNNESSIKSCPKTIPLQNYLKITKTWNPQNNNPWNLPRSLSTIPNPSQITLSISLSLILVTLDTHNVHLHMDHRCMCNIQVEIAYSHNYHPSKSTVLIELSSRLVFEDLPFFNVGRQLF